jgi:hypothetical protein
MIFICVKLLSSADGYIYLLKISVSFLLGDVEKWKTTSIPGFNSVSAMNNCVDCNEIGCGCCGENLSKKTF